MTAAVLREDTLPQLILVLQITLITCQYESSFLKPDVSFDEQNDRYDLSNLIQAQNNEFKDPLRFRRTIFVGGEELEKLKKYVKETIQDAVTAVQNEVDDINVFDIIKNFTGLKMQPGHYFAYESENRRGGQKFRRDDQDFAYHDEMKSAEPGNIGEYDKNLEALRPNRRKMKELVDHLHGNKGKDGRRSNADPKKEILFHHAFPIDLKLKGYLQLPRSNNTN